MRVLVCEDNDEKFTTIEQALLELSIDQRKIIRAKTFTDFSKKLQKGFDLCIADFWMPLRDSGVSELENVASDILSEIDEIGGFDSPVLVISEHYDSALEFVEPYYEKGCIIYDYNNLDNWKSALKVFKARAQNKHQYEFIILVAVEVEKQAYYKIEGLITNTVHRQKLEFIEVQYQEKFGAIIELPKMGLVNAAVVTSQILENFNPEIICMSGICAGLGKNAALGQLLVAEMCWEYQSGKWLGEAFVSRPYQVTLDNEFSQEIRQILSTDGYIDELENGFVGAERSSNKTSPKLTIFSSGSAVIASSEKLNQVKEQHDKVEGLDMEIFGFYRAIELSNCRCKYFAAKTVVDNADSGKNDKLQEYGSYISAKFCLDVIYKTL